MTLALTLLLLAAVVAVLPPRLLGRAGWVVRTPRVGVAVWLLTIATLTAALIGAAVATMFPLVRHLGGFSELVHRCPEFAAALRAHVAYLVAATVGAAAAVAIVVAGVRSLTLQMRQARAVAARHVLALLTSGQRAGRVTVVAGEQPAAWSVASGRGYIVLTQGALDALSAEELQAVVLHEQAHLRGRHHLTLAMVIAARRAFPCRLTTDAVPEVGLLLEMMADDAAARRAGGSAVARALLHLSGGVPVGALGAGGESAHRRMSRLLERQGPARGQGSVAVAVAVGGLALPALLVVGTAAGLAGLHVCPPAG